MKLKSLLMKLEERERERGGFILFLLKMHLQIKSNTIK